MKKSKVARSNMFWIKVCCLQFDVSHVNYIGKLADILADKGGHEIITYQPINNRQFNNTGTKRSKLIIREPDYPLDIDVAQFGSEMWAKKPFFEMLKHIDKMANFFANSCRHQLNDQKLLDQLRAENASLGLTEYFDMCGPLLFHKIGLKFAVTYAAALPQMMTSELGIPAVTSFLPGMMTAAFPPLNFQNRLVNVFAETKLCAEANLFFIHSSNIHVHSATKSFTLAAPDFQNRNHWLMSIRRSWTVARRDYLMPPNIRDAFLSTFDHFPEVTFLWKYEKENDFAKKHPNLITSPWLAQTDLLAHPKMLAFLTHGGANSIIEASTIGTPLIVCPLFADQPRNAILVEFRKIGVQLDAKNLTTENIVNAMREIIDNPSYRQNAKEMAKVIAAKPMNADETFVKYAELAAKFDLHSKLDIPGRHLSTFVFYNIDVYLFCVVVLTLVILLSFFITRLFVRCIRRRLQKSKTDFDGVNGLKFLAYNGRFSRSHVIYMGKLADELAKAGHEVVNYQPILTKEFNETGVKYARTITRELSYENDFDQRFMHEFVWSNETVQDWIKALRHGVGQFGAMFARTCEGEKILSECYSHLDQLHDKEMMRRLKAENFDLALLEYFGPCSLGLLEAIALKKYIAVYSMPLSSLAASFIGLPSAQSFVPDLHSTSTPRMTFLERLKNMFMGLVFMRLFAMNALIGKVEEVIKREVNPNFDYTERAGEAEFVFVNADSLLDYPRPISSKVVYIGGMGIDQRHVSFRLRAKEVAQMLANKPEDATETMTKHAVFAANFNVHEHLDMEGRKMSFITYYNCDVFVFLVGVFVA
ncbi:Glucuronosyltransferase [Aphelenchoides besseyi]|nr:Glucuronosyltransferase [Aphelenchoides besseyi]